MATVKPCFLSFGRLRFAKAETKGETYGVLMALKPARIRDKRRERTDPQENVYAYEQQRSIC
jgi:hypothetical protein